MTRGRTLIGCTIWSRRSSVPIMPGSEVLICRRLATVPSRTAWLTLRVARRMGWPAVREPDLGRKNIPQGAGTGAWHAVADLSRHVGERTVSIPLSAGAWRVAVPPLTAGVVSRHPVVGGPVGSWLAVASPARRRATPHRRSRHVAGPSREWRHPRLFCHDASFPLAAPRHARADGVALSAAATRPAVRQAMARTHALAIPRQVRPEVPPPAAISVLERALA